MNIEKLKQIWKESYSEDFVKEYPGVAKQLPDEFTATQLSKLWSDSYGEFFEIEYPDVYQELTMNQSSSYSYEDYLDGLYVMFKNQFADRIDSKKGISWTEIKNWYKTAYKSDKVKMEDFYNVIKNDDDIKVLVENAPADSEYQVIDGEYVICEEEIQDVFPQPLTKIQIEETISKIKEAISEGCRTINQISDFANIYESKEFWKTIANHLINEENIAVLVPIDYSKIVTNNLVSNKYGIVGNLISINENVATIVSGDEIILSNIMETYMPLSVDPS